MQSPLKMRVDSQVGEGLRSKELVGGGVFKKHIQYVRMYVREKDLGEV